MVIKLHELPPPLKGSGKNIPYPIEGHQSFTYEFFIKKKDSSADNMTDQYHHYDNNNGLHQTTTTTTTTIDDNNNNPSLQLSSLYPDFRESMVSILIDSELELHLFDHAQYNKLYIKSPFICHFGGSSPTSSSSFGSHHYYDDLYLYHVKKRTWHLQKTSGDKPTNRQYHAIAVCPDKHRVYLFGGKKGWGSDNNLYYLDLQTFVWHLVPVNQNKSSIPSSRHLHSMVYVNQCLYLFGGSSSWSDVMGDFWIFDTRQNLWKQITYPTTNTTTTAAAASNNTNANISNSSSSSSITPVNFPSARHGHVMHAVNSRIYLIGGTGKGGVATSDIWMFNTRCFEWKRLSTVELMGHGTIIRWNEELEEEVVQPILNPVEYTDADVEELLRYIPSKFAASCVLGNHILICGGELSNKVFNDVLTFDTEKYTLDKLGWEVRTVKHSLASSGTQLFLTGGKYIDTNNCHYMTEVGIPGNFPLVESSLQLLAEVLTSKNESEHTKGIVALSELVEQQTGIESIIDTSPSIQKAIIRLLRHASSMDVQAILQALLNYFEVEESRCLSEQICYEVLHKALDHLDPLIDNQPDLISKSSTTMVELSLIRQFVKLFHYIAVRYEKYNSYILLKKIQSVMFAAFSIPHLHVQEEAIQKDVEFYAAFYQIICHIQSVMANTLHELVSKKAFIADCDIETVEKSVSQYCALTEYITFSTTENNTKRNKNDQFVRQFDEEIERTRKSVVSDLKRLLKSRKEVEELKPKPEKKRFSTITSAEFLSPKTIDQTTATDVSSLESEALDDGEEGEANDANSLQRDLTRTPNAEFLDILQEEQLTKNLLDEIKANRASVSDILHVQVLRDSFQTYIDAFSDDYKSDYRSLLFWCHVSNFKYLIQMISSEPDVQSEAVHRLFEELCETRQLFFSKKSEFALDPASITKYRKVVNTLDMLISVTDKTQQEDIVDTISERLFEPVLKDIEASLSKQLNKWAKSESFKKLETRYST